MSENYDSRADTLAHIDRVQDLMDQVIENLRTRQIIHDKSKLEEPEKSGFDKLTPLLAGSTYGSDEYKGFLKQLKPVLDHHYAHNSHHPEHWPLGVENMSLMDVVEMLADWRAAGERHANGSMEKSLSVNRARFKLSPQLCSILINTVRELNWMTSVPQLDELAEAESQRSTRAGAEASD